jgi:FdhD protein
MKAPPQTETRQVLRWQNGAVPRREQDELAAEEPLEIRVETRPVAVTMRTPGHDDELVCGFLFTEGFIRSRTDLLKVAPDALNKAGNVLDVFLAPEVTVDFARLSRHVFTSSSCGLCGKASIEAVHRHFQRIKSRLSVPVRTVLGLPEALRQGQQAFARTGGLHAAAIFTTGGKLVVLREDVGRHNAVDKVLGYGLLNGRLPFDRHILMVSGRASFEILQKALAARIPIVAAVSAPSNLAAQFAEDSGQMLIGFLRADRLNVYSRPQRIQLRGSTR